MMEKSSFYLLFYFVGSLLGLLIAGYFTWFGDLDTLNWPLINLITDEWSLLLMMFIFSFAVYCFLHFHYEIKKLNKPNMEWWQKGVIYQIYPKSFKDSNGDGIGDLKGITEKIDYFKQIGVNILYLNPIYPHGGKDNGYDITSYTEIDKEFGTMRDFDSLVEKLHKNDMQLIVDFVPNHTSDKHEWFIKSSESDSPNNPYRDYYIWYPSDDKKNPPNNWVSFFSRSAWTYHEKRKAWYYHTFLQDQPDLNMRCPKVQEEMKKVLKFWLHTKNVDGIRIDAMKHLFVDALFRNEPKAKNASDDKLLIFGTLDHIYTTNQPENFEILIEWRAYIDEISKEKNRKKIIFVESHGSPEDQATYYNYNNKPGAHFPLNTQLARFREIEAKGLLGGNQKLNPQTLKSLISGWNKYSKTKNFWSNWQTGTHDMARLATRIGPKNVKLANALCLLIGGTAFTYYGEEIGMEDLDYDSILYEECQDDFAKRMGPEEYKKYNRDYCRSPMQWDDSTNSGFTKANVKPWMPIHPNYTHLNVKHQLENPRSTLRVYSELIKIRQNPSFVYGDLRYAIVDEHVFSFIRHAFDNLSFLVAMNLSDEDVTINLLTTRLLPSKINTVYYFDNNEKQTYEPSKDILTKSVFLPAKSCLIGSWFAD